MKPEIDDILSNLYPEYAELPDEDMVNPLPDDVYTKDDFWDDLSEKEKYDVNAAYLRVLGKPEYDYLVCWEPGRFDNDDDAINYTSFYDIDVKWWEFQKQAMWDSIEDSKKWMEQGSKTHTAERVAQSINRFHEDYAEYKMYMTGDWFRLIENDVFLYSQMIGAKWYIFYKMETLLDDLQEENIPYSFREGDDLLASINEPDPEKRYDAGGREKELESYHTKIRKYTSEELLPKIDKILEKYNRVLSGKTFRVDRGYEAENFDPFTDFIFFDEQSLKNVNPQKFLNTFKNNQVDIFELDRIISELQDDVAKDFERIYNENRSRYIQRG